MSREACTIVVNSCDAYEDVWAPFFAALKDKWPTCPYKIVLNTESKSFSAGGLNIASFSFAKNWSRDLWGKRLRLTLDAIDSEFVIMLFDDFILEDRVDHVEVLRCIERMNADDRIAVFYFINIAGDNDQDQRFSDYELLPTRKDYRLNSAPSIWRRKKLLEFTGELDTPWAWEFFGSARTYRTTDLFYCVKPSFEKIFVYNYKLGGAIHRGKWVKSVIQPAVERYELILDLSKRGFQDERLRQHPHSFIWRVKFVILGFRMIGLDVCIFLYRAARKRLLKVLRIKV